MAKTKDDYVDQGAKDAYTGVMAGPVSGWQKVAYMQGWDSQQEAMALAREARESGKRAEADTGKDVRAIMDGARVKAEAEAPGAGMTRTQKKVAGILRGANHKLRMAKLDKEMRASQTVRGNRNKFETVSHNITRGYR